MRLEPHEKGGQVCPTDPGEPYRKGRGDKRVSIVTEEGDLLRALAVGRRVLEIGTGLGIATRAMAQHASEVWTVDPDPWVAQNVAETLPRNVHYRQDRRSVVGLFDLAFIDGNHEAPHPFDDLQFAMGKLLPLHRSLIVMHDSNAGAVEEALKRLCLRAFDLGTTYRLALVLP